MKRALVLSSLCVLALVGAGGVVAAQSAQDPDAPVTTDDLNRQSLDSIGDLIRETAPQEKAPPQVQPPAKDIAAIPEDGAEDEDTEEEGEEEEIVTKAEPDRPVGKRQRRQTVVMRAIDKITAEAITFEVRVGGPPVRFKGLIFNARACEVSASDERIDDAVAYMEVRTQPRAGQPATGSARQLYRGWMFASSPAVTGLEHPIYDAWVVNCKA